MFDGFRLDRIDVGDVQLRVRYGGHGPPVLLLHGHPRTHATWHRVAPPLARDHTVVCPDLRGYGQSGKPADGRDHVNYSKRAMAADCLALMRSLGHDRFAVVGHDRGGYVALRLALDHPEAVTRLAFLGGPAWASTGRTTTPTRPQAAPSPAPRWCSGRPATRKTGTCTPTSSASGKPGLPTCAAARSTAATTWRKKTRASSSGPYAPFWVTHSAVACAALAVSPCA